MAIAVAGPPVDTTAADPSADHAAADRTPAVAMPVTAGESRWDTPARLRAALALAVTAGLLVAGPGAAAFSGRADAVDRARVEAADLVTVQTARTRLLAADAQAATNVLLAREAPPSAERRYRYAVEEAALRLTVAARAGNDAYPLAAADAGLVRYGGQVATARAAALDGRPDVAAATLRRASAQLRRDVLPRLDVVQQASARRLDGDLGAAAGARLLLLGVGASTLLLLLLVQVWLARHTRRVVNPGLLAATAVAVLTGGVALGVLQRSEGAAEAVRVGPAPVVADVVAARAALFEARSAESRSLLGPAPGQRPGVLEQLWGEAAEQARSALQRLPAGADAVLRPGSEAERAATPLALLAEYEAAHGEVRQRLQDGDRRGAVAAAADPSDTGAAGSLENLDTATAALLARQGRQVDDGLARAGSLLRVSGWLCLVAGLATAVLAARGVGRRLAEYR